MIDKAVLRSRKRHGFTLTELLVVIGIIAILIPLMMPDIVSARRSETMTLLRWRLHWLSWDVVKYYEAHGTLPKDDEESTKEAKLVAFVLSDEYKREEFEQDYSWDEEQNKLFDSERKYCFTMDLTVLPRGVEELVICAIPQPPYLDWDVRACQRVTVSGWRQIDFDRPKFDLDPFAEQVIAERNRVLTVQTLDQVATLLEFSPDDRLAGLIIPTAPQYKTTILQAVDGGGDNAIGKQDLMNFIAPNPNDGPFVAFARQAVADQVYARSLHEGDFEPIPIGEIAGDGSELFSAANYGLYFDAKIDNAGVAESLYRKVDTAERLRLQSRGSDKDVQQYTKILDSARYELRAQADRIDPVSSQKVELLLDVLSPYAEK